MKQLLFLILLTISTTCFSQKVDTITPPDPVDTTALDTLDHFDNPKETILFLQVHQDGSVDSLWVPLGGSIGDFTPTTKEGFANVVDTLTNLLWPLLAVLLTFASVYFKKLRGLKIPGSNDKRVRSLIASAVVLVGGFFVKFQDGGSWLSWVTQNLDLPIMASGLYALILKPLLNKIFPPKQ